MELTLDRLAPGQRGRVSRLDLPLDRARGLTRLGLRPGTEVVCLRRLPLGDPTVYRWRGSDVALRSSDAAKIKLRTKNEEVRTKK